MIKKHLLSSISMQSDNRWKGNFKKKERNLGSLAAPISSVSSNNKIRLLELDRLGSNSGFATY